MANPNPSPATRFKPGQSPNPGGKTSEQRKLEIESARIAAEIRNRLLSTIKEKLDLDGTNALEFLNSDALRLFKDSEDRAHGTPRQSVDIDQTMTGEVVFKTVYEAKPR